MSKKILIVYSSAKTRQQANLLEKGGYPFLVGHLDKPEYLLKAVEKISPAIVVFYHCADDENMFDHCLKLHENSESFDGLLVIIAPEGNALQSELAVDAGANALILGEHHENELIVRIQSLLKSRKVSLEHKRRSRSLARASAEAADIIVQLEEADRRIREQNEELKKRDRQILAQQAEIQKHLDNVQHEMQLAASLQISLMPSGREFSQGQKIKLFDRYIPAADLGGDYYDYVKLPGGGLFICIADVTGHGVAPALVSVQIRALARSHLQAGQSLPAVITDLNTFMYETFHQEYLMTMAGIIYHPEREEVEFVGAGHCPLIHYSTNTRSSREIFSKGLPLGVMSEAEFISSSFILDTNDRLLLYTDGITEANNSQGQEFCAERMVSEFTSCRDMSSSKVIERLLRSVDEYTENSPFADDVTLVMLERN